MTTTQPVARIAEPVTTARRRWIALGVLMLPVLLISVDNTVLAFALPAISAALRPSGTALLWIVDVYPLLLAGLLVPMGSLGDRIGRRRLLMIGSAGFALLSVLAGLAPSAPVLIALRALMGVFGSMLMPATLSLIRNIFTDATERRTAIAVWAAAFSGGAALGPILGGFLLEHFWWGSVFWMAVVMLIPLLVLAPTLVPESRDPQPGPVDPVSIVLALATMTPFVWAIKTAADQGVSLAVVLAAGLALTAGTVFVRRQLGRPRPMLDVRLFTVPTFSASVAANLLSVFSMIGFLYFISQHLQLVSGRSPMGAGLLLVPGLAVTVIAGFVVVRVVRTVRPAHAMAAGLVMNAVGYGVVLLSGNAGSDAGLVVAFAILGAGVGTAETISNDLILASVPAERAGAASAISETAYETGAVLGTAVLGSILNAAYRAHIELPAQLTDGAASAAGQTLGGAHEVASTLPGPTARALLRSAREAFDSGVGITASVGLVLMFASAAMVLVVMRER